MKKFIVLVAGGSGSRMKSETPKQFLPLNGTPVFIHTIRAFLKAFPESAIILVLPESHLQTGKQLINKHLPEDNIITITGGDTRYHSVKNGLSLVDDNSIVFVHDAVRCLVKPDLIRACYESALNTGAAIPVVEVKDSMRMITEYGNKAIDRKLLRIVQTPQVFHAEKLKIAFDAPYQEIFTDEANVMECFGYSITLVAGDIDNIKITHPSDLQLAAQLLADS